MVNVIGICHFVIYATRKFHYAEAMFEATVSSSRV